MSPVGWDLQSPVLGWGATGHQPSATTQSSPQPWRRLGFEWAFFIWQGQSGQNWVPDCGYGHPVQSFSSEFWKDKLPPCLQAKAPQERGSKRWQDVGGSPRWSCILEDVWGREDVSFSCGFKTVFHHLPQRQSNRAFFLLIWVFQIPGIN